MDICCLQVLLGKQQLALVINTRTMTVRLPKDKILRLVIILTTIWHANMKSFVLLEGITLLRNIEHAASICPWVRSLYCTLRSANNHCLRLSMQDMSKFP